MSFLKQLEINNFRIFDQSVAMDIAPITLLVGGNNSGKSTIIRAIKLLFETAVEEDFYYILKNGTSSVFDVWQDLAPYQIASQLKEHVLSINFNVEQDTVKEDILPTKFRVELEYMKHIMKPHGVLVKIHVFDLNRGTTLFKNDGGYEGIDGHRPPCGLRNYYDHYLYGQDYNCEAEELQTKTIKEIAKLFINQNIYLPTFRNTPQKVFKRSDATFLSKTLFAILDGEFHVISQYGKDMQGNPFSNIHAWDSDKWGIEFCVTNETIKNIFLFGDRVTFNQNNEHGYFELMIHQGESVKNVADLGFGSSNLISLLLGIDIGSADYQGEQVFQNIKHRNRKYSSTTILYEEPELHLHPNFQSKLADVFVSTYKEYGVSFILETHSEYIIRKLQYLVARKKITSKDIAIYYFPDKTAHQVPYKIEILENGRINKPFGKGFYDESTSIMMSILTDENIN